MLSVRTTLATTSLLMSMFAVGALQSEAAKPSQGSTAPTHSYAVDVPGKQQWVDTKIDVRGVRSCAFEPRDRCHTLTNNPMRESCVPGSFGPAGLTRGFADLVHQYAVTDAGHGALIGRIGSSDYAQSTGGDFYSDGRILVLVLKDSGKD
jgi:hypothetical protein